MPSSSSKQTKTHLFEDAGGQPVGGAVKACGHEGAPRSQVPRKRLVQGENVRRVEFARRHGELLGVRLLQETRDAVVGLPIKQLTPRLSRGPLKK